MKIRNELTLLHYAAWQDSLEIATVLIEHGLDTNIRDSKGETPLHRAARHNAGEMISMLIENGADINAESDFKRTPLDIAILLKQGNAEQVLRAAGGQCNQHC